MTDTDIKKNHDSIEDCASGIIWASVSSVYSSYQSRAREAGKVVLGIEDFWNRFRRRFPGSHWGWAKYGNDPEKTERQTAKTDGGVAHIPWDQWLRIRKEAGLRIDPNTAEVTCTYVQTVDPYGVCPDLPEECNQIGKEHFARSPESDIWVVFGDLPNETREKLWKRMRG